MHALPGSEPDPAGHDARFSRQGPRPTPVAVVASLARYPVKSGAPEGLTSVALDDGGLAGDRALAIRDGEGRVLRAKDHPALARLTADDLRLDASDLSARLGVPGAHLGPAGAGAAGAGPAAASQAPRAAVHLVGADAAADPSAPAGADPGRRANIVLTGGPGALVLAPGAERAWVGSILRIGAAELLVTALPRHCLGVYADVVTPGAIAVGDTVHLVQRGDPARTSPAGAPGQ